VYASLWTFERAPKGRGRTLHPLPHRKEDTPVASVAALTDLTVSDLWKEVKDEATLWGDISRESLRAVKCLLLRHSVE